LYKATNPYYNWDNGLFMTILVRNDSKYNIPLPVLGGSVIRHKLKACRRKDNPYHQNCYNKQLLKCSARITRLINKNRRSERTKRPTTRMFLLGLPHVGDRFARSDLRV